MSGKSFEAKKRGLGPPKIRTFATPNSITVVPNDFTTSAIANGEGKVISQNQPKLNLPIKKVVEEVKALPVLTTTVKPVSMSAITRGIQPSLNGSMYKEETLQDRQRKNLRNKMLKWNTKSFLSESVAGRLSKIKYQILDKDQIEAQTGDIRITEVLKTTHTSSMRNSLNDLRMGPKTVDDICETCQNTIDACLGHPGRIDLTFVIYNVALFDELLKILSCICLKCSEPLIMSKGREDIKEILNTESNNRIDKLKKISDGVVCSCGGQAYNYAINDSNESKPRTVIINESTNNKVEVPIEFVERVLLNIDNKAVVDQRYQLIFSTGGAKMIRYLTYSIMVIAPRYRLEQIGEDGTIQPAEITKAYNTIITFNNEIASGKGEIEQKIVEKVSSNVNFKIVTPEARLDKDKFLNRKYIKSLPVYTAFDVRREIIERGVTITAEQIRNYFGGASTRYFVIRDTDELTAQLADVPFAEGKNGTKSPHKSVYFIFGIGSDSLKPPGTTASNSEIETDDSPIIEMLISESLNGYRFVKSKNTVDYRFIISDYNFFRKSVLDPKGTLSTTIGEKKKNPPSYLVSLEAAYIKLYDDISGSLGGKEGNIRGLQQGKRVGFSARDVIGPNPYIDVREAMIPQTIANKVTKPIEVTINNLEMIKKWIEDGTATKVTINNPGDPVRRGNIFDLSHFKVYSPFPADPAGDIKGDLIHRKMMDGDYVIINRQPTLHKQGFVAFRVVVNPDATVRNIQLHPAINKAYGADHDGDEVTVHVPQSAETEEELKNIAFIENNILDPQKNRVAFAPLYDAITASYRATQLREYRKEIRTITLDELQLNHPAILNSPLLTSVFDRIRAEGKNVLYYETHKLKALPFTPDPKNPDSIPKFTREANPTSYIKIAYKYIVQAAIRGVNLTLHKSINDFFHRLILVRSKGKVNTRVLLANNPDLKYEKMASAYLDGGAFISTCFPLGFNYNKKDVVIRNGILVKGTIKETHISLGAGGITHMIALNLGEKTAADYITAVTQNMTDFISTIFNQSVSIEDMYDLGKSISDNDIISINYMHLIGSEATLPNVYTGVKDVEIAPFIGVNKIIEESDTSFLNKMIDEAFKHYWANGNPPSDVVAYVKYQTDVSIKLGSIPARLGERAQQIIEYDLEKSVVNQLLGMILSLAKGGPSNVGEMIGSNGVRFYENKTPILGSNMRVTPHFSPNEKNIAQIGMGIAGFNEGILPVDYFIGQQAGRESQIAIAIKTPDAGDFRRTITKSLEDLRREADGRVIFLQDGHMVQTIYGGDGLDSKYISKIDIGYTTMQTPVDVRDLIYSLNKKYAHGAY